MVRKCLIAAVCIFGSCAAAAIAAPISGFGVFGGISSTSISGSSLAGLAGNGTGAGIGFDYQAAVGEKLTINPQVMIVHETGGDILAIDPVFGTFLFGTEFDYTIIGVQLLFWPRDDFYLGGGFANHSVKVTLTEKSTGISASDTGSGTGPSLALGFQAQGGLFLSARYDTVEVQSTTLSSLRVLVGYRFH